jgi:NADPH:quinone reductase-like Zn-dependent oxidoreductase
MKAVVTERYGSPDVLTLKEVDTPRPGPHDVLVRVHAASVNDWDCLLLRGTAFVVRLFNGLFTPNVQILGGDVAGREEAVGEEVKTFQPGDDVYGDLIGHRLGAFAEYVCAPEACLVRKPSAMTFEQAAAIPQAGMLAVQGLIDVGRIRPGLRVLLNGAGGGVGTFGLQIAKLHDVEVTAVDKAGKLEMLHAMGADHVIDYLREDFTRRGACYDLILDVRTTRSPLAYARVLNRDGIYATVGGSTPRLLQILGLGPLISRSSSRHVRVVSLKPNKDLAYLNDLFEAGKLIPVIDRSYTLADVPEAFRFFSTGDHKGKITVIIP